MKKIERYGNEGEAHHIDARFKRPAPDRNVTGKTYNTKTCCQF